MAFTHDDVYKPMPGYKVMVSHFHFHFNEQLTDDGTMDVQPTWLPVFRALGINMAILADFHSRLASDRHGQDPPRRAERLFRGLRTLLGPRLAADSRRRARREFRRTLHVPVPEAGLLYAREAAGEGPAEQPFVETWRRMARCITPALRANELDLLKQENGLVWQTHPRTKGSTGYPGRGPREGFFPERSLPGRIVPIAAGGSVARSACARSAASACWTI